MAMLSETQTPNGGWQFRDPAYNFVIDRPLSVSLTLDQAVERIIACRQKNPAITATQQKSTEFEVVKLELLNYTRARLGMPPDDSPPKWSPARQAAAFRAGVANAAAGVKVGKSWLGDGLKPVAPELAEKRAAICVRCPQNQKGNTIQQMEGWIAQQFKRLMEYKNEIKAKTSLDDKLQTCQACDCDLTFKVHSPLEHILKGTTDDIRQRLDRSCWILSGDK